MTRWFRFYDEALNDPKILKLSDKLYRLWVGILCIASKNEGRLPSLDDMALMIRAKPEKLHHDIETLITAGLIDRDGQSLKPHNWNGRQYKSDVSTPRVQRFRNSKRNVSETPPDTEQITDTEKKDAAPSGAHSFPSDQERDLYRRGKEVLGPSSGGLIANLLKAKGSIPASRAIIETASEKFNAREYVGRVIAGSAADIPERGIIDARANGIV
jgi:hypothetical protein